MNIRYRVELSQAERCELTALLSAGKHPVRRLKRAQILLAADQGISDEAIAKTVGVGASKHASWLNMVEIEIGVLRSKCLARRIDNKKRIVTEIAASGVNQCIRTAASSEFFNKIRQHRTSTNSHAHTPKEVRTVFEIKGFYLGHFRLRCLLLGVHVVDPNQHPDLEEDEYADCHGCIAVSAFSQRCVYRVLIEQFTRTWMEELRNENLILTLTHYRCDVIGRDGERFRRNWMER